MADNSTKNEHKDMSERLRKERLAQALRANLRRRKQQARGRAEQSDTSRGAKADQETS